MYYFGSIIPEHTSIYWYGSVHTGMKQELNILCIVCGRVHTFRVVNVSTRYKTIMYDKEPELHMLAGVGSFTWMPLCRPIEMPKTLQAVAKLLL